ncbi:B3 domain-containing protein REM5-like isoform X2 [Tasmannia lanceolata]|uniref:B3 domain-containing protein REM5-like isoform X2 n=1 Tax=Tasmannia lanceolata TaxID=3420 RepID=UPI0040628990
MADHHPRFFKFMMPGFSEKLSIPGAFHKYLTREGHEMAILKSPLGKSWSVEVKRGGEGIWFEKGWCEFVQDHGLCIGEALTFQYHGNMVFDVLIYDNSSCLKEFPPVVEKDQTEVQVEEFEGMENQEKTKIDEHAEKRGMENHFRVTVKGSHLTQNFMNIPREFQLKNGLEGSTKMTLRDPKGRSWPVVITPEMGKDGSKKGPIRIMTGWLQFAKANSLEEGNVCIFDLSSAEKDVMNVRILRGYTSCAA